ncbi:uncharacterized protein DS421_13g420680 [Arachis hypogaea]|nr:uncharacterized protein DS421_13g420680 [Arachis hypogaea]
MNPRLIVSVKLIMLEYWLILVHNWVVGVACGALVRLGVKGWWRLPRRSSIILATRGIFWLKLRVLSKNLTQRLRKDCKCCWILTLLHSKWTFWSYRSPIGALSIAFESKHLGLSSNI